MNILKKHLTKENIYLFKDNNLDYNSILEFCVNNLQQKLNISEIVKDNILEEFKKRELKSTTIIDNYLAIPHIKSELILKSYISLIYAPNGIYDKNNNKDIKLVLFSCVPKDETIFSLAINSTFAKFYKTLDFEQLNANLNNFNTYILELIEKFNPK